MKILSIGKSVSLSELQVVWPDDYEKTMELEQEMIVNELNNQSINKTVVGKLLKKGAQVVSSVALIIPATIIKGILTKGGLLEKNAANFMYIFANEEQVKMMPEAEKRKKDKQLKIMRFFTKAPMNMREKIFKSEVRNGILRKFGKQPEELISQFLNKKIGKNAYIDFVYNSPKVLDLQVKRNLINDKIKNEYEQNKIDWRNRKIKAVPLPPQTYIALVQSAGDLISKLLSVLSATKKSKDELGVEANEQITPDKSFFESLTETTQPKETETTQTETTQPKETETTQTETTDTQQSDVNKDNTMLYVGLGAAAVVALLISQSKK